MPASKVPVWRKSISMIGVVEARIPGWLRVRRGRRSRWGSVGACMAIAVVVAVVVVAIVLGPMCSYVGNAAVEGRVEQ